jgi:hypothetical protein
MKESINMKLLVISFFLLFASADFFHGPRAFPQGDAKPALQTTSDADVDAVYAAVLKFRAGHPGEGPKAKQVVLIDTTVGLNCFGADKPENCISQARTRLNGGFATKVDSEAVEDFLSKSEEQAPVSRSIPFDQPQIFISKKDEDELFQRKGTDGWQTFYSKYPKAGGITSLSRVGFNKAKDCAILYSSIGCGWLCGTGHYHLLKKEGEEWKLIASQMLWIS